MSGARTARGSAQAATLVLVAVVLVAGAALAFLALRGPAGPSTAADRARAVADSLRCPSCQDLSVADSPSAIAGEIRRDIARRLAAGQSPARIRAYYVERYGPWILLSPPTTGVTLFAWLVPGLLVGAGVVVVALAIRRWTAPGSRIAAPADPGAASASASAPPSPSGLAPADRRLLDRALATLPEEPD